MDDNIGEKEPLLPHEDLSQEEYQTNYSTKVSSSPFYTFSFSSITRLISEFFKTLKEDIIFLTSPKEVIKYLRNGPAVWSNGDWNAFCAYGTNLIVNLMTLTTFLQNVLKFPDELIFDRILPATGLMMFLSTSYYSLLAYRLARIEKRENVCALPSGISTPHMFIVIFVIMLPILLDTNDPIKAWEAGLAWVFLQSCLLIVGGFIAPFIQNITPRSALLGTLTGVSITFISMRPAFEMFINPVIGITCFAVTIASFFGGIKYPGNFPAGLISISVGTILVWFFSIFSIPFGGNPMSFSSFVSSFKHVSFYIPFPAVHHVIGGMEYLELILVTAIPFGIYDLIEAMDNVESAGAAGDKFSTIRVLSMDGVVSMIGALMGNPFINAVYIGQPGFKRMGGRIGYSFVTGILVLGLCWFGFVYVLLHVIPIISILPILLYIGMLVGAQSFQASPLNHAPAIILSLIPHLAAWVKSMIDSTLQAANTSVEEVGLENLQEAGVLYKGISVLGGGAILSGLMFAAICTFVIDSNYLKASCYCLASAILTYFGLMHADSLGVGDNGLGVTPDVTFAYLILTVLCLLCNFVRSKTRFCPINHDELDIHFFAKDNLTYE